LARAGRRGAGNEGDEVALSNNGSKLAMVKGYYWSESLRVDKKLSNDNSWRETYEEDEAAL